METSIASSPSISKQEVFHPTYESNVHFDWGLEGCAMEIEVDKEDVAIDVVVLEPKSQQQVFSSEKELVEWTRSMGKRYGFIIIIKARSLFRIANQR
ncbi:hypothetical protein RHMOL_Rhmol04G0138300 [Rhododendron molle]|uniref:Uncharacterized protein n=1 Tax=Rhododendron molle TaxID=49168 RepID=A0ACC0P1Z0_RHOML|nr:hypothetical protein RHMOL_Rhmol04G0138300 [Rhododendron molle]